MTFLDEVFVRLSKITVDADFGYWSKMPHWTLDEAISLSIGCEPRGQTSESVTRVIGLFAEQFSKWREFAHRANIAGKVSDPVSPNDFLDWASKNDVPVRPELVAAVRAQVSAIDWRAECSRLRTLIEEKEALLTKAVAERDSSTPTEKTLGTLERNTLLKLFCGLVVVTYGERPGVGRSSVSSEIQSDLLTKVGLEFDAKTIRKYLKQGAELLPPKPEG